MIVLRYLRKYREYRSWYINTREDITHGSKRIPEGLPMLSGLKDREIEKNELLEKLENSHRHRVVAAIDEAKLKLACTFESPEEGKKLVNAVFESCIDGSESNFEAYAGLIACERTAFYTYKSRFIKDIKEAIGI